MLQDKYLLKKAQRIRLSDILSNESERFYSNLKVVDEDIDKYFYITMISNISLNIYDFYIDVNRRNNIFYKNVNYINSKLVKVVYKLISTYIVIKFLNTNNNSENCDIIEENNFKVFKYTHREKKLFYKLKNKFIENEIDFDLSFNFLFAKKVFSSKKNNPMEFAYINYFIENLYTDFCENYERSVLIC